MSTTQPLSHAKSSRGLRTGGPSWGSKIEAGQAPRAHSSPAWKADANWDHGDEQTRSRDSAGLIVDVALDGGAKHPQLPEEAAEGLPGLPRLALKPSKAIPNPFQIKPLLEGPDSKQ